jgi:uncharacterized membrane protein HdeD (DUF308 family)
MKFLKSIKYNLLSSAVLCILLGIVLLVYPDTSLTIVCRAVGVIVLITGLGFVGSYLRVGKTRWFGKVELVFGSIFAILGGFIVLYPLGIISIVPLVFGILLVYHGIANMKQAFELRQYKDNGWWLPVLIAASTIALGVVIMRNPFGTIETLMRIIGVCILYDGLMNTMLVGRFVKSIRNFRKIEEAEAAEQAEEALVDEAEIIEGEYKEL